MLSLDSFTNYRNVIPIIVKCIIVNISLVSF